MQKDHYRLGGESSPSALSSKDARWLRRALTLAASSTHRQPMAAVAVSGGRSLVESTNRRRNSPLNVDWQECSFHAEQNLLRLRPELRGTTVYVARLTGAGAPALARPCRRCHTALTEAGVRRTVWTGVNGSVGIELLTTGFGTTDSP